MINEGNPIEKLPFRWPEEPTLYDLGRFVRFIGDTGEYEFEITEESLKNDPTTQFSDRTHGELIELCKQASSEHLVDQDVKGEIVREIRRRELIRKSLIGGEINVNVLVNLLSDLDKDVPSSIKTQESSHEDAWRDQFKKLIEMGPAENFRLLEVLLSNDKGINVSEGEVQSDTWMATYQMVQYYADILAGTPDQDED